MTRKKLTKNLFIGNKRDKTPLFCLLGRHCVRHVQTKKKNNDGHCTLRRMKVLMEVIEKHARENICWVERRIY